MDGDFPAISQPMKPGPIRSLPQSLALLAAPLLALTYASSADVMVYNEANTTGVWTVPAGTNLLNGATATPAPPVTHEGSSNSWATLTDGIIGTPGTTSGTVTPNNATTVSFPLDVVAQPAGYDLTTFDSYVIWGDSGRTNQNYTLQYSTVGDPTTFLTITAVANSDAPDRKSTHTSITDTSGVLATGVHTIRIVTGAQENGYVGFTELKARAVPTNVSTLVESNTGNAWTLPSGNLLNGFTASPATTSTQEGSSADWSTVTNGTVGTAAAINVSVTPPNNTGVTFPLDLSTNTNGYKLSSLDTYCSWPNSGRDNQDITISYSTVAAPTTFIRIGNAVAHTGADNATHVRLTPISGFLARNVAAVRFDFGHQENGYVGYREFIALGSAEPLVDPLTWTGASGSAGNANWVTSADNNWKKTDGGAPAPYNPNAEVTFDQTGNNRNISIPSALSAALVTVANNGGTPYTFGGQLLTVTNSIGATGSGTATFNGPVKANAGLSQSGTGSMVFNGPVEGSGVSVTGTGSITLNASNPSLTGTALVSDGTLTVAHDEALQNVAVTTTGGVIRFTSIAPHINRLSGTLGTSVVLGNATGPASTFLIVGEADSVSSFEGNFSQVAGTASGLTKTGSSTLILNGSNNYTGPTVASGGVLQLGQRYALYNGDSGAWTADNLQAGLGGTLLFDVGGIDEFTEAEMNALPLGGFENGSALGLEVADTMTVNLSRNLTQPGLGLLKSGTGELILSGNNTSNGLYYVRGGVLTANSTTGHAIGGSVLIGGGIMSLFLNTDANDQFAPGSVITFSNGGFYDSKINLHGTSQTVAGLDAAPYTVNKVPLVQNDEIGYPGYQAGRGPATLTIDTAAATTHSFYGLIRNQDGAPVSVVKKGTGTQEFLNSFVQGFGYTGLTDIQQGKLRLNFSGGTSGFASNVTIASGATFELDGAFGFNNEIAGSGSVVKTGAGTVTLGNSVNSYTGTTKVSGGTLGMGFATLADTSTVDLAATATLNLTHAATDRVSVLIIDGVTQPNGIYGAVGSGAPIENSHITGTGKLEVNPVSEVTYDAWSAIIPNAADRDRTDDPDGDGFSNLQEFLFGTSPVGANGTLTPIEVTPTGIIIHWNQRATGSSVYTLKESTTLQSGSWVNSGATISNSAVQDLPDYIRKQAVISFTGGAKFARVEATE